MWLLIYNTSEVRSCHSSIPILSKTSHFLQLRLIFFCMAFDVQYLNSLLSSFFGELYSQVFSTGVLLAFLGGTTFCSVTNYRIISLLGFSAVNANNTSQSLWQPKLLPSTSETPRWCALLPFKICSWTLFAFLPSFPVPAVFLAWNIAPSHLHTLIHDALMKLTLIPSSKRFLLLLEFQRRFLFTECLPHIRHSCQALSIA